LPYLEPSIPQILLKKRIPPLPQILSCGFITITLSKIPLSPA